MTLNMPPTRLFNPYSCICNSTKYTIVITILLILLILSSIALYIAFKIIKYIKEKNLLKTTITRNIKPFDKTNLTPNTIFNKPELTNCLKTGGCIW